MKTCGNVLLLIGCIFSSWGQFSDPFEVEVNRGGTRVEVAVMVPEAHYLYADAFSLTDAVGNEYVAEDKPAMEEIIDPNSGKPKGVYAASFQLLFEGVPAEVPLTLSYWGCNDSVCFIPQTKQVGVVGSERRPALAALSSQTAVVQGKAVGFLNKADFLRFLDETEGGETEERGAFAKFVDDPVHFVSESGLSLAVLFILVGGLALNLTPCILPMIPINLAIIGAGAQAGTKGRGFALGAVYGLGIALVYGLLGVAVVLTGSQFGTLQSNPWFNAAIALIFVVLALAMFGVFTIDFSSFQKGGGVEKRGRFGVALSMGAVAALLAGACVAPVVIAVLLLATNVYATQPAAGLALPFLLGLGMALPWPFAGAGLSFLPKPGRWMEGVKLFFGIMILGFAFYYGSLSYKGFVPAPVVDKTASMNFLTIDGATNEGLEEALAQARATGQSVFLDFWASWCKNCQAMDKRTFLDPEVQQRLAPYLFIKYIAEDPTDSDTKQVMEQYGVQGLPTFVIIQ
jgi:thiol:disulfide interchange protein